MGLLTIGAPRVFSSLTLCFSLIVHFSSAELSEGSSYRCATQGLKQTINHYGLSLLENCTDQITCESVGAPRGPGPCWHA